MVIFNPISCYTVNPTKASKVATPPNDYVINPPDESTESLWLSFKNINMPQKRNGQSRKNSVDSSKPIYFSNDNAEAFHDAKVIFENHLKEGVFQYNNQPSIYVYVIEWPGWKQVGIIGQIAVEDWKNGKCKPNENVLLKNVEEIVKSTIIQKIYTGFPVLFGDFHADLSKLVDEAIAKHTPFISLEFDNARHSLYRLSEAESLEVSILLKSLDCLYLADGHHRSRGYLEVVDVLNQNKDKLTSKSNPDWYSIPSMVFNTKCMQVLRFNRVLPSLLGWEEDDLIKRLSDYFDFSQREAPKLKELLGSTTDLEMSFDKMLVPAGKGTFAFYFCKSDRWFWAKSKGPFTPNPMEKLDAHYLSTYFFTQTLGINDLSRSEYVKYMPETSGSTFAQAVHCIEEDMAMLIVCPSATIEDIKEVSNLGLFMPPKSTLFYPKPLLGLIIKDLPSRN